MEKVLKKFMAIIAILSMMLAFVPANAFARTLTINGTVAGRTFDVYKIFDAENKQNGEDYTYVYSFTEEAANFFVTGNITGKTTIAEAVEYLGNLQDEATELYTFASAYAASDVTHPVKTGLSATGDSLVIEGLDDGYYLVVETTEGENAPTPTSANMLIQVGKENKENTEINLKAVTDTVEKDAQDTAFVGETVTFTVKTKVPNTKFYTNAESYVFDVIDTMSEGLDYVGNLKVTIGGTEISKDTDYTADEPENDNSQAGHNEELKIHLGNYAKTHQDDAGKEIVITYDAKVNKNAIKGSGASNDVEINRNGDEIELPGDVEVYTFNTEFEKKSALGKQLNGAEFELKYSEDGTGEYKTIYVHKEADGKYIADFSASTGDTITGGKFEINGLKDGFYKLVETKAPDKDENGNPISGYAVPSFESFDFQIAYSSESRTATISSKMEGDAASYLTLTSTNITLHSTEADLDDNYSTDVLKADLLNSKASALPSTGGMGTKIFTAVGVVVMISAAAILVYRNRKNK